MFDALLFDLDGTLVDTESVALRVGLQAFAALGVPVDLEFLHSLVGIDLPSSAVIISSAYPLLDQDALHMAWRQGFYDATATEGLAVKTGVTRLLDARLLPMAVVTSSGRPEAHRKLALAGIAGAFDLVVTLDDVARAKPAPDAYLLAAERMGVSPARCLVFEDSEAGAQAAHRAGCTVVQVPDVVPSAGQWAHHLADDLISGARAAGLIV